MVLNLSNITAIFTALGFAINKSENSGSGNKEIKIEISYKKTGTTATLIKKHDKNFVPKSRVRKQSNNAKKIRDLIIEIKEMLESEDTLEKSSVSLDYTPATSTPKSKSASKIPILKRTYSTRPRKLNQQPIQPRFSFTP